MKIALYSHIKDHSPHSVLYYSDVACLVSSYRSEILSLSETCNWLHSSVLSGKIHLPGYSAHHSNRNHCGFGLAVYCANHLSCSVMSCGTSPSTWCGVIVSFFKSDQLPLSLALGCTYFPPKSPSQSAHDLCSDIESVITLMKYVIATGDFNIDKADVDKHHSKLFHHLITSHTLTQPISPPMRYSETSKSILDLFVATPNIPIFNSMVLDSSIWTILYILLDLHYEVVKPLPSKVVCCSFKNFPSLALWKTYWWFLGPSLTYLIGQMIKLVF